MFVNSNVYEGMPARLYRSPCEIRRDMTRISKQIKEADEMLSIRNILVEMLTECSGSEPSRWITELEEIVKDARDSLDNLQRLKGAIDDLSEELEESLCAIGTGV